MSRTGGGWPPESLTVDPSEYPAFLAGPVRVVELGCHRIHLPNHWFWRWSEDGRGRARIRYFDPMIPRLEPVPTYSDPPGTVYRALDDALILTFSRPEPRADIRALIEAMPVISIQIRVFPRRPAQPCTTAAEPLRWEAGRTHTSARPEWYGTETGRIGSRAYHDTRQGLRIVYDWDGRNVPPDSWPAMDAAVGEFVTFLTTPPGGGRS